MKNLSFIFATIALLCGCTSSPLRSDVKAEGYSFQAPSRNEWMEAPKDSPGRAADHIFTRAASGAMISVGSVCNRYEQASLKALQKDVINVLNHPEIVSQDTKTINGREALLSRVRGGLDGVPVEAYFMTWRKDDCLFDVDLYSRDAINPADEKTYLSVIESLKYDEEDSEK